MSHPLHNHFFFKILHLSLHPTKYIMYALLYNIWNRQYFLKKSTNFYLGEEFFNVVIFLHWLWLDRLFRLRIQWPCRYKGHLHGCLFYVFPVGLYFVLHALAFFFHRLLTIEPRIKDWLILVNLGFSAELFIRHYLPKVVSALPNWILDTIIWLTMDPKREILYQLIFCRQVLWVFLIF